MDPEMDRKPENKAPTEPFPYPKSKGPKRPLKERWATYQPNKISMYKAVGYSVFLTIAVGFTLGGWHTRGGTQEVARTITDVTDGTRATGESAKEVDHSAEMLSRRAGDLRQEVERFLNEVRAA